MLSVFYILSEKIYFLAGGEVDPPPLIGYVSFFSPYRVEEIILLFIPQASLCGKGDTKLNYLAHGFERKPHKPIHIL